MLLDEILTAKQQEIEEAKQELPLVELETRVKGHLADRSLSHAIGRAGKPALIAELKRKSPSAGMLRDRFDPVSLAQALQEAGACALSVLTDEPYFGGHLDFLRDVKSFTEVPILRKDFILETYQVYQAAYYQADAVLLIVGVLEEDRLFECLRACDDLGLEALVEVHSEPELKTALSAGAHLIGINHRNLKTFEVEPDVTERLMPLIPSEKVVVAESGIQSAQDVKRMQRLGVHAVLIGEALMRAADVGVKVRELFAGVW